MHQSFCSRSICLSLCYFSSKIHPEHFVIKIIQELITHVFFLLNFRDALWKKTFQPKTSLMAMRLSKEFCITKVCFTFLRLIEKLENLLPKSSSSCRYHYLSITETTWAGLLMSTNWPVIAWAELLMSLKKHELWFNSRYCWPAYKDGTFQAKSKRR